MRFIDRENELERLNRLATRSEGGLAVVYGRRRIGKTRLLLEWSEKHSGLYTVGDQSSADVQRAYFAEAVAQRLLGFADVVYPDWRVLLERLAREADAAGWRGPVIFDELPYLVLSSPELPSVLQRWTDHEARAARLVTAIGGSSQRMMQGIVLDANSPLYGRAHEMLELAPLDPSHVAGAFDLKRAADAVKVYAAWGGVPRYWELALEQKDPAELSAIDALVLDPSGTLHREPDRLLVEELPPASELRPVLDAIGAGAHRVSEIAARVGCKATSLSRPLSRLRGLGLVRRDVPFGKSEKKSRRSLYEIGDPFFRLWFRVVAPHRSALAVGLPPGRLALLKKYWPNLLGAAWEDLVRKRIALVSGSSSLGSLGPWAPASRWWRGNEPEWDLVTECLDGKRLLLGEAKWSDRPLDGKAVQGMVRNLLRKAPPKLPRRYRQHEMTRVLCVPELNKSARNGIRDVFVLTAADLLA